MWTCTCKRRSTCITWNLILATLVIILLVTIFGCEKRWEKVSEQSKVTTTPCRTEETKMATSFSIRSERGNYSPAKVYVILMIKCDFLLQRLKIKSTGRFRDQELRHYGEPLTKDILLPRKELQKTGDLLGNRSYLVSKRLDVIPRSYNLFSILLGKRCESVIILC